METMITTGQDPLAAPQALGAVSPVQEGIGSTVACQHFPFKSWCSTTVPRACAQNNRQGVWGIPYACLLWSQTEPSLAAGSPCRKHRSSRLTPGMLHGNRPRKPKALGRKLLFYFLLEASQKAWGMSGGTKYTGWKSVTLFKLAVPHISGSQTRPCVCTTSGAG